MVSRHHCRVGRISGLGYRVHRIVNDCDIRNAARAPKSIGIWRFNGLIEDREGSFFNSIGNEEPGFAVRVGAECSRAVQSSAPSGIGSGPVARRFSCVELRFVISDPLLLVLIPPDELLSL